jgi:hypothetical protein
MSTKSQVTIFIIIGLVLLGAVVLFLLINNNTTILDNRSVPEDVKPINSLVLSCVERTLSDAVDYVSRTGGYYDSPEKSIDAGIAYYIYDNSNYMPSKESVGNEISKYMNNELFFCTGNFEDFSDFTIEESEISSKVDISDEKVTVKVNYPLTITKADKTYKIDTFESQLNVRLGIVYDSVKKIIDDQKDNKEGICIGCIENVSETNDLYISTLDYDTDTVIYSVRDDNSKINNNSLVFNFVNKYDFE